MAERGTEGCVGTYAVLYSFLVVLPSAGGVTGSVAYRLMPTVRCEMLVGLRRAARTLERRTADLENILAEGWTGKKVLVDSGNLFSDSYR